MSATQFRIKLFVSYCHVPSDHGQRVQEFFASFRKRAGIECVIDTDIKSPQRPEEQWPHWMEIQIEPVPAAYIARVERGGNQ